ncbi:carboxymuconolactone decarboxylase family protein [uncultured Mailhella sp.]|uniref:carboxymuconolactone decarboxylase family protein n=1 Tax=uncultured Mailhella sp. TaxID=1981031 RepID=UPI0025D43D48|nr:carboxymuconolactone decarboxylase family protein [uncultured Mailhella sp.]
MNECKVRDACAAVSESRADLARNNPDVAAMRARLERDAFSRQGALSTIKKHLVTLSALTALRAVSNIREKTEAALADGVSPVQIREAVYQCAPYAGFPATEDALREVDAAFSARGIALPLENQATVTDENRFEKGLAVQKGIFGDVIDAMHASAPEGQKAIMVDHLSAFCFGDIYTRNGLDLKTRELLTFSIISALGGCESQVKSHVQGNANAGNAKQELIDALEVCLPLMGFPRTLNALSCVNAVMPD